MSESREVPAPTVLPVDDRPEDAAWPGGWHPASSMYADGGPIAMESTRILVVEDEETVLDAVIVALRGHGYEVLGASDGARLDEALSDFRPDLAILDIQLSDGPDGLALARRIRSGSDLPLIFLTARGGLSDRLSGFEAGADDYIVKPFSMSELLARVRSLLKRAGRLSSVMLTSGDLVVDRSALEARRAGERLDLTNTEFELLVALAERKGKVVSKDRLLSLVWGFDAYDPNLVEVHISSLRRKLEQHGPRIIATVRGAGYRLTA